MAPLSNGTGALGQRLDGQQVAVCDYKARSSGRSAVGVKCSPGANTVKPSKKTLGTQPWATVQQPEVLLLVGPVPRRPGPPMSSPTQELTHPTVEGSAAPEVSSISCGSFL